MIHRHRTSTRDNVIRRNRIPITTFRIVLVNGFIRVRIRVLEDDVPCVDQPGEDAETAEREVDDAVGATDAAFDPYWWGVRYMYRVEGKRMSVLWIEDQRLRLLPKNTYRLWVETGRTGASGSSRCRTCSLVRKFGCRKDFEVYE
jgi:hypothetical protein